jgi:hypothetical protein
MRYLEKYGRIGQVTDDNITRHTHFACWITKATDTHSECVRLMLFHGNNEYTRAPQSDATGILPVLLASHTLHRSWLVIAS